MNPYTLIAPIAGVLGGDRDRHADLVDPRP